ncbi:hypothetical protein HK102_006105, partial [Quaeritorhiza haematococci]
LKEVEKHVKKLCAKRAIDRQSWIEVGMAIHHATDRSPEGQEIWDTFSCRAGQYDRRDLEYQWDLFKNGSGITIGSLIHWAKEDAKKKTEERKEKKALEEKTKTNNDLCREAVKFGVDHTGGKGVFDSWDNTENLVAVIKNTMHHPDHRVRCVLGSKAAFQQCLECGWRNPICGHLSVPQSEYPMLHQQFFNITINNTVNHYNGNAEVDISWNKFKEDNIRIVDDPETNDLLIGALSGTNQRVAELAYHLYGPQFAVVNGCWYNFNGVVWEQDKERYEIKLCLKSKPFCRMFVDAKAAYMKETFKIKKRKDKVQTIQSTITKLESAAFKNAVVDELGPMKLLATFIEDINKSMGLEFELEKIHDKFLEESTGLLEKMDEKLSAGLKEVAADLKDVEAKLMELEKMGGFNE